MIDSDGTDVLVVAVEAVGAGAVVAGAGAVEAGAACDVVRMIEEVANCTLLVPVDEEPEATV